MHRHHPREHPPGARRVPGTSVFIPFLSFVWRFFFFFLVFFFFLGGGVWVPQVLKRSQRCP